MNNQHSRSNLRRALLSSLPACVLGALLGLSSCGSGAAPEGDPRIVVIGIDGADWKLIDALVAEGRMPNLAGLRERGTSGPIQTLIDFPLSPVIWTSVVTGKTPVFIFGMSCT